MFISRDLSRYHDLAAVTEVIASWKRKIAKLVLFSDCNSIQDSKLILACWLQPRAANRWSYREDTHLLGGAFRAAPTASDSDPDGDAITGRPPPPRRTLDHSGGALTAMNPRSAGDGSISTRLPASTERRGKGVCDSNA